MKQKLYISDSHHICWSKSSSYIWCTARSRLQESMGPTYDRITWHWLP